MANVGIDRDQEILAVDLNAMAREVEQADAAGCLEPLAELAHEAAHLADRRVLGLDDLKARFLQRGFHQACVVHRVAQRRVPVA